MPEFIPHIEKTLTALAMPVGMLWIFLFVLFLLVRQSKQKFTALVVLLVWIGLSIAGNDYGGALIIAELERPYRDIKPLEEKPFDAVVVLGGGTSLTPCEKPQLAEAGDRVALGARLYHANLTPLLVATGENELEGSINAAELWQQLNVPEEAIIKIGGRNTAAEMQELARLIKEKNWINKRLGLITSAAHMSRALRLARDNNLALHPLPADFKSTWPEFQPARLIPSGSGLYRTERATKELLARVVGR